MINEAQVKKYCSEDISKIENYEQAVADTTQTWHCHHLLEIQGQFRNSEKLLKRCGMYYNVPASQLIFLTKSEHRRLHGIGRNLSEETKKKMSMSLSGEKHPMFGKRGYWSGKHRSEETKKKMSMSQSGEKHPMFGKHLSEETRKKMSLSLRGKSPWNKGKHHSEETKKKLADAFIGTQWWNNGSITKRAKECPGQGWVRGRIKFLRKTK